MIWYVILSTLYSVYLKFEDAHVFDKIAIFDRYFSDGEHDFNHLDAHLDAHLDTHLDDGLDAADELDDELDGEQLGEVSPVPSDFTPKNSISGMTSSDASEADSE